MHVTYDMRIGGTEQVIKNLIENTDAGFFEMSVCCIEPPLGPFAEDLQNKGVVFHQAPRKPGFDTQLIKVLRRLVKTENVDVLHCHQYTPYIYGALAAAFLPTKVVFTEHGRFYPDFSTWKRKLINPLLHKLTFATTAISVATKNALVEYENIPENDIQVIYNGIAPLNVDTSHVLALKASLHISEETLVMGTIARFDPIKNHLMMLAAFRKVLDTGVNAKLIIVGDGEMRISIEEQIESLNLAPNVILTGYITNPKTYLGMMDIFLLSSLSEGASMTLLEAMSLGKPCVVTDAGGNSEIVKHGETGIVTKNDDDSEFAQGILSLVDGANSKKLGENGLKQFNSRFSVSVMCGNYLQLYRQACG